MAGTRLRAIAPSHTAIVTLELQRGVVGDRAHFPALREAVQESGLLASTARLLAAARAAGATVIHCTIAFPRDGASGYDNVPLLRRLRRDPDYLRERSPEAELVPELGAMAEDLVSPRAHGMAPFTRSSLEKLLREAGIRTLVATGVSLNVGIPGLVIDAVDRGFEVIVPIDCVVGVPRAYGRSVLEHSLQQIATLADVAEIQDVWGSTA